MSTEKQWRTQVWRNSVVIHCGWAVAKITKICPNLMLRFTGENLQPNPWIKLEYLKSDKSHVDSSALWSVIFHVIP